MWVRCVLYVALGAAVGGFLLPPAASFAYGEPSTPKVVVIRHTEVQIVPVYVHESTTTTTQARRSRGSSAAALTVPQTAATTTSTTTQPTLPGVDCTAHGDPFAAACTEGAHNG